MAQAQLTAPHTAAVSWAVAGGADGAGRADHAAPPGQRPVTVTTPLAWTESPPVEVEPLDGRRLTHCPATPLSQAAELLKWSGNRWSIEIFFGISKTGCRVEALRLGTVERLEPALALYLSIAWRMQYLTALGRSPPTPPTSPLPFQARQREVRIVLLPTIAASRLWRIPRRPKSIQ